MADDIIVVKDIVKEYIMGEVKVMAAKGMSFQVGEGEFVVVLGPSGSGKSTVLNIVGGMDRATSGEVWVNGTNIAGVSDRGLTMYRRKSIGFVFQFYNLLPNLTALENVELVAQVSDNPLNGKDVMKDVGLDERLHSFPAQLSGGEQQRVAIARAISMAPSVILADEPTGSLDSVSGKNIMAIFQKLNREQGITVVQVTHDESMSLYGDRVFRILDGKIERIDRIIQKNAQEVSC